MEKICAIAKKWGLKPEYIREIKSNVWEIDVNEGRYALKASALKEDKLRFIAAAQKHLDNCGFQGFARPILYKGSPYFLQEGRCYTLYDWVEGDKCDFDNISHLSAAAKTLGEFHLYSRREELVMSDNAKAGYWLWPEKLAKRIRDMERFQALAAADHSDFFSKMYLGFSPPFLAKAWEARRMLLTSSYQRIAAEDYKVGAFIHYDVAARNFIIQKDRAYLIDFDYCSLDLPVVDLMRLIKRSLKYGGNSREKITAIVDSYSAVRPLSKEQWQVLYALLLFPQKFWRLAVRYFDNQTDWEKDTFDKKIKAVVRELENEDTWLPILRQKVGLE
ncbi:MAG: CotS family spore coat protein [Bacillota bacterium]|nr:CotS family spore coat protein [Bacillota bacterium]